MLVASAPTVHRSLAMRRIWLGATLVLTLGITVYLIIATGPTDKGALRTVIFLGSGVHVAATAWFFTVPAVRAHARAHAGRYIVAPVALIVGTALVFALMPRGYDNWVIAPYFAWQYFHYQKQNVGMASLALVSNGYRSLTSLERQCIVGAGVVGIVGLFARPELLGGTLPFDASGLLPVIGVVFAGIAAVGLVAFARRRTTWTVASMFGAAVLFFAPTFVFRSPVAAATSFATAHGYQYLLIVGLVAAAPIASSRTRIASLGTMIAIALLGGFALERLSGANGDSIAGRLVFGAYLGVVMSHFVIDAGLWRLRDSFPRQFLSERLPYLIPARPTNSPTVG